MWEGEGGGESESEGMGRGYWVYDETQQCLTDNTDNGA